MPGVVLKNCQVLIDTTSGNLTDVSDKVRRVRIQETYDLMDDTRMGLNSHSRIAGLIDWRVEVDFLQNYDATTSGTYAGTPVNKYVQGIYASALPVNISIRPFKAVRTPSNPEWSGPVILETFNPVDAEVGALAVVTAAFRSAGDLTYTATCSS